MTGVIRFGAREVHLRIAEDGTMFDDVPHDRVPAEDSAPELLTRRQVAALFGVSTSTVTRWAKKGILKTRRTPGGHYRFPAAEIRKLALGPDAGGLVQLD